MLPYHKRNLTNLNKAKRAPPSKPSRLLELALPEQKVNPTGTGLVSLEVLNYS